MNQTQQPASGQEVIRELHKTLCELQRSLIRFTSPIQEDQNERSRRFNSECPGKVEYETIRGILKQQKQLLQQECNEGKDTSQRKLVLDLLRSNWRYLLFQSTSEENEQLNSVRYSRFLQRETREFHEIIQGQRQSILFSRAAYARTLIYVKILLFPTNLQQNDNLDRDIAFKHHLTLLISYLTDFTAGWKTDDSQAKRLTEETNSGEVNSELWTEQWSTTGIKIHD